MRLINNIKTIVVALFVAAIMCACSSYDDPDIDFKGNIDNTFMNSLARGTTSVTFTWDDILEYEMDYKEYQKGERKWEDVTGKYIGGALPGFGKLIILNGCSWSPVSLTDPTTSCPSMISAVWPIYCRLTGFDKEVYVACPIEFDAEKKTLKVDDCIYNIEKAEGDNMILSTESVFYRSDEREGLVPSHARKYVIFYKKATMESPDMDKVIYFDSNKEAQIAMVVMLREYFGDKINLNSYGNMYTYPIVNLALLEEGIRNDNPYDPNVVSAADSSEM